VTTYDDAYDAAAAAIPTVNGEPAMLVPPTVTVNEHDPNVVGV
jgi:hypothetical protein